MLRSAVRGCASAPPFDGGAVDAVWRRAMGSGRALAMRCPYRAGLPRQVESAGMAERLLLTPSKARRLVSAALTVDETLAHVDRSLRDFDGVLVEFRSLLVDFAAVLERFNETVGRVDETVDRVGVTTTELGEVVDEMGGVAQTFSPALALNDQFRRQLDRLRSLAGSGESETTPAQ
jgi:hypothetical protein